MHDDFDALADSSDNVLRFARDDAVIHDAGGADV